jgi:hypothetical protein
MVTALIIATLFPTTVVAVLGGADALERALNRAAL